MNKLSKFLTILTTILVCVSCDQATKIGAQNLLQGHAPVSYLGGTFSLIYAENTGAMLSLGESLPANYRFLIFVVFVGIFLLITAGYVWMNALNTRSIIGVSLVLSGGIGNLIDRMFNGGSVVDFMFVKIGPLQTGIFNVADMAIVAGVFVLCFSFLKSEQN